jgi:DNA-binding beta-propeller fold protein YncE/ABC-type Fe3+ transport system permease subunit
MPVLALLVFISAMAWPAAALLVEATATEQSDDVIEAREAGALVATTAGWSVVVALVAAGVGWLPGRVLGSALGRRGFVPLSVACLAPILFPSYVVFWTWSQVWSSRGWLFAWAARNDQLQLLRSATLLAGLVCWSWPLVAWCVAGAASSRPEEFDEMLRLDGAGRVRLTIERLRSDASGIALGAMLAFVATFNNTTCFDLALVRTIGYELRAIDSLGAPPRQLIATAWPAMAVAGLGAAMAWRLMGAWRLPAPIRTSPARLAEWSISLLVWLVAVALPLSLLFGGISNMRMIREFFAFYGGRPMTDTLLAALAAGALAAVVALGLATLWQREARTARWLANVQAIGWLVCGLVPGTLIAIGIEAAYNRGKLADLIYLQPVSMVMGYVACFGFVGALLGRWIVAREPASLRDLRRLDGPASLRATFEASWPRLLAGATAAFAVVAALSLGEIPATARLRPVGFEPLAGSILNAMHYQQPETVMVATLIVMLGAIAASIIVAMTWAATRRWTTMMAIVAMVIVFSVGRGCSERNDGRPRALPVEYTFGTPGLSLGQFSYPRAIAVDPDAAVVYVIDKTARVQRYGIDGTPQHQWSMPKFDNGKPTGVSVAPDGRVFVADTHCFRVMVFDRDGRELMQFGEYGEGPGQFIFPTDIAFAPDGRIFVSEYGGNDRVQVFDPAGQYLFGFGSLGSLPGQFSRPQSMAFSRDGLELYIADACNHRIQVFDPANGALIRVFGEAGGEPGKLAYPYGLMVLDDGSLMVCEYGNNRIQRFSSQGAALGTWGRVGAGDGELRYPWAVDGDGGLLFVLDSGNHRVQVMESP